MERMRLNRLTQPWLPRGAPAPTVVGRRDTSVPRVRVSCDLSAFCALGRRSAGPGPPLSLSFSVSFEPLSVSWVWTLCEDDSESLGHPPSWAPPPRRFSSSPLAT